MRKGTKTIVIIAAGALAAAAAIGASYRYSAGFRSWVAGNVGEDDSGSSQGGSSSQSEGGSSQGESSTSETQGQIRLDFANGKLFGVYKAATVGEAMPATATLLPANATDKTIDWLSGDSTKVKVTSAQTASGSPNSLKLVAIFSGTVTVTVSAEADSSVAGTFTVSCYNQIASATLQGIGVGDNAYDADQGAASGYGVISTAKEYYAASFTQGDPQTSSPSTASTVVYNVNQNQFWQNFGEDYMSIQYRVWGFDKTRLPSFVDSIISFNSDIDLSASSIDGVAVYGANAATFMPTSYDGMKKDFIVMKDTTTAGNYSAVIEVALKYAGTGLATDKAASKALSGIVFNFGAFSAGFSSLAYVAPTSVSGGSVLFN